jgi:hypothetical protein
MEKENRSLESESRRREEEERLSYIMRHAGGIKTVINPFLRRRDALQMNFATCQVSCRM